MEKQIDKNLRELFEEHNRFVYVTLINILEPKFPEIFKIKDSDYVIGIRENDDEDDNFHLLSYKEYQETKDKFDYACSVIIIHGIGDDQFVVASTSEMIENTEFYVSPAYLNINDEIFLKRIIDIAGHSQSSLDARMYDASEEKEIAEFLKTFESKERCLNYFTLDNQLGDIRYGFLEKDVETWFNDIEML
jgi:hypothetical protein